MNKYEDKLVKEYLKNRPVPILIAHAVVARNSGKHAGDGTDGHVYAFTKKEDAQKTADDINKTMKELGIDYRTYSVEYIHIFDKQFKTR